MDTKSSFLKNIIFFLIGLVAFSFFLELFLRFVVKVPNHRLKNADLETSLQIPGIFKPGQDFVRVDLHKEELPYRIIINSKGLRGKDFEIKKKKDTFRILCLGDSYTFGILINQGETYPEQLESILNNNNQSGLQFEVINAGVSGYTLSDEYDFYRNKLYKLNPNLVIIAFVMNDVPDYSRSISPWRSQQKNAEFWSRKKYISFLRDRLIDTSIYNAKKILLAYMRATGWNDSPDVYLIVNKYYDSNTMELWNKYFDTLIQFKKDLDEKGTELLLVIFPVYAQIYENATVHPQEYFIKRCSEIGVETLDLTPAFRESAKKGKKLFYMPIADHPTPEGCSVTVNAIKKYLFDSKKIVQQRNIN